MAIRRPYEATADLNPTHEEEKLQRLLHTEGRVATPNLDQLNLPIW